MTMASDLVSWTGIVGFGSAVGNVRPFSEARSCNCVGPRNGDPVCPCRMPAYREREAGRKALEFLRSAPAKPRFRVKAGSRVVSNA